MIQEIQDLIEISRFYGGKKDFVIAGRGITSYKDDEKLWIKASGVSLDGIDENGFVVMDRKKLQDMPGKQYSSDPYIREQQFKTDLYTFCPDPGTNLRPSVETNLHDIIEYSFVIHLHPAIVNALTCSNNSKEITAGLFSDALYIPYTAPGYTLFRKVNDEVKKYRQQYGADPKVIFIENHGILVSGNSTMEIINTYSEICEKIESRIQSKLDITELPVPENITEILPAIRMILSADSLKTLSLRHNSLIEYFYTDELSFEKVSAPFTPDMIVYSKSKYLYINESDTPGDIIASLKKKLPDFRKEYGYYPQIIIIKDYGLIAIGDNSQSTETSLDVYEDLMKISYYSDGFGGPRFLNKQQIDFIESWEAENYRGEIAKGTLEASNVSGKTAIVTGGAMGFGAGIASSLYDKGANVIIADINAEGGLKQAEKLNAKKGENKAHFIKTDTGDPLSVKELVKKTVEQFGGLDLMVANAGILYAGGLDEMDEETFEKVTKINYSGYFYCAKHASAVMKLQYEYKNDHYSDVIQVNSKSGLKGSNKNFTYAGGKFGGIGLTQSFALELMPYNIKVNSICPGNFFEGHLWSDPEKGLFVQYLNAGKVPGAKTIEDVKKHYENQVPAGRGCRVEDVTKAIYYVIEQKYETGQAVPVTGGQIMLH